MAKVQPTVSSSTTGLVIRAATFRMAGQCRTHGKNRDHFLALCATMTRRILVNHSLARRAAKPGAYAEQLMLTEADGLGAGPDQDLVAAHQALLAFEQVDARAAKVVELRFPQRRPQQIMAVAWPSAWLSAWLSARGAGWRGRSPPACADARGAQAAPAQRRRA